MVSMDVVPASRFSKFASFAEVDREWRWTPFMFTSKQMTSLRRHLPQCTSGNFPDGAFAVRSARERA